MENNYTFAHTTTLTLEVSAQHFLPENSVVEDSECGARAGPRHDGRRLVLTRPDTGHGDKQADDFRGWKAKNVFSVISHVE